MGCYNKLFMLQCFLMAERFIDRLRASPARYAIPNGMTLARPFLGHAATKAYKEGKKWKSLGLFTLAGASDMEGAPARHLNATSSIGEAADPLADRIMTAEFLSAIDMDERAKMILIASEATIALTALALLAFQKKPKVRAIGKVRMGTHVAGGAALIALGENKKINKSASWAMAGISVAAAVDYGIQARKILKK